MEEVAHAVKGHSLTYLGTDRIEHQRVNGGDIEMKDGEAECLETSNDFSELARSNYPS